MSCVQIEQSFLNHIEKCHADSSIEAELAILKYHSGKSYESIYFHPGGPEKLKFRLKVWVKADLKSQFQDYNHRLRF